MEEVKSNSGQSLGIAALITGIITFVIAVIPCVGMIAFIPGIIAIILGAVGLSQASRQNAPKGILLAGLIIGIVAVMISFSQFFVIGKVAKNSDKWSGDFRSAIDEVRRDVMKDLEDANVSIKIESNGDTVLINTSSKKKDFEQKLEDLESGNKQKNDTTSKSK
jgi:membrane-bound ClpP family serine protease